MVVLTAGEPVTLSEYCFHPSPTDFSSEGGNIMHQQLLNASVAGSGKAKFIGVARGEEKFAFLYVVISAVAVGCAMTYSFIAGLAWWQTMLVLIGGLSGAWATVFSFLEIRRLAQTPKDAADEALKEEADPYTSRAVFVEPPTGDPYPHHEDYAESAGLDQGQLTSQLPDSSPLLDTFLSRRRSQKQKVAR
jgi:hypothetical protein